VHPQTLRHYEKLGFICPHRTETNIRLYSPKDLERVALIKRWTNELGVNLAGVEVMLKMMENMEQMRADMEHQINQMREEYEAEIRRLKEALLRVTQSQL